MKKVVKQTASKKPMMQKGGTNIKVPRVRKTKEEVNETQPVNNVLNNPNKIKDEGVKKTKTLLGPAKVIEKTKVVRSVSGPDIKESSQNVPFAKIKTRTVKDLVGHTIKEKKKIKVKNPQGSGYLAYQKKGGSTKMATGGTTKATKFAALAPPYNKATAADRIAGAKKNKRK